MSQQEIPKSQTSKRGATILRPKHPPVTKHGTYLERVRLDGVEPLENYEEGGFHPIHLGDILGPSQRYHVSHKLGQGGFGTVWLCKDLSSSEYVAVKVMCANVQGNALPDLRLKDLDKSIPGAEYVAFPIDQFCIDGPNGIHQCIVLPVLGPCVSPELWTQIGESPEPKLRKMAHQAAKAMNFLHKNNICHGDFRPANILVKLKNINNLSEEDVTSLLGEPQITNVLTESRDKLPHFSPKYLVTQTDLSHLDEKYLTDEICVVDFGEAFPITSPPEAIGIPENYLPRELLLDEDGPISKACDIWALGCSLFEIRQQVALFYMISDPEEILSEIVRFFGKFPEEWWSEWDARQEFFDDEGEWIKTKNKEYGLKTLLTATKNIYSASNVRQTIPLKSLSMPEEEQVVFADLLRKVFHYPPEERVTVEDILDHPWFYL